jgi:hypothetical protein
MYCLYRLIFEGVPYFGKGVCRRMVSPMRKLAKGACGAPTNEE